ncbi:MAG TPA: lipase family protein [Solirubrobacterales bacterium]|nr:lipase family protein [Solirubrobacterales bacterium]
MSSPAIRAVLSAAIGLALFAAPASAAQKERAPRAPSGSAFYSPPKKLVKGRAGTVVWSRASRGLSRLSAARVNRTIVYRSRSISGKPSVVSGTIAIPKGRAPRGGWPVVSWGHVTTGSADTCAPSAVTAGNPELERLTRGDEIANLLLERGIAVARSDFEGIGTPGPHPYLIGKSLGRSMIDIVRAGRSMKLKIGRRWIPAGHSEGGQGALFAASMAAARAPELKLRGASAFAPASHIKDILELARLVTVANPATADFSALGALILEGAAISEPSLWSVYREGGGLSSEALAMLPQTQSKCLVELARPDSFGGLAPASIEGPGADTLLPALFKVLDRNDPRVLKLPGVPVRLDQGLKDFVVMKWHTDEVAASLSGTGAKVEYVTWPDADHTTITDPAQAAGPAADWLAARLR